MRGEERDRERKRERGREGVSVQFSRQLYIEQKKKRSVHSHLEEEDVVIVCLEGGRHRHHVRVGETVQHVQLVVGVLARL